MAVLHRIVGTAVLGAGLLLPALSTTGVAVAQEASAHGVHVVHGGLTSPVSRAAACGVESTLKAGPACVAAAKVSGRLLVEEWDDLRVADVAGRDREMIPDGKLCSGGLDQFGGLDLARADWPATDLAPGANYTFRYRGTIPHQGTFRMYVTANGYDPSRPLTWSDLERKPFLKVTDPLLADGSYTMKGRLPAGKNGRHLIYTIWQNSDTPDTYYSCSDVVFGDAADAESPSARTSDAADAEPASVETPDAAVAEPTSVDTPDAADATAPDVGDAEAPDDTPAVANAGTDAPAVQDGDLVWVLGAAGLLAIATAGAIVVLLRRR